MVPLEHHPLESLKEKIYDTILRYPAKTDQEIGEQYGVGRSYVWKLRQKFVRKLDFVLAQHIAGAFLAEFQQATDYFKFQVSRLEDKILEYEKNKKGTKIIFKMNTTGQKYADEVELNAMDRMEIDDKIRDIMKQQQSLWKDIVLFARQGEAVEIIKMIQDGRIKVEDGVIIKS